MLGQSVVLICVLIFGNIVTGKPSGDPSKPSVDNDAKTGDVSDTSKESNDLSSDSSEDSVNLDIGEVELYGPAYNKKWIGDVFGGGYRYEKRDPYVDKGLDIARLYTVNKNSKHINDADLSRHDHHDGKQMGITDSASTGLETDLTTGRVREHKRLFGYRLGNGFALGKRTKRSLQDGYMSHNSDREPLPYDSKQMFYPDEESDDELVYYYPAKRYFHSDPGHRFAFGKRSDWKRYFGHVLGGGFRFGKRDDGREFMPNADDFMDYVGNRDDYFLRPIEMFSNGEHPMEPRYDYDRPQVDKRFGYVLGRGFRFGKRPDKRYGWVLGRGFFLKKRDHDLNEYVDRMLHRLDDEEEMQKRFGHHTDPHTIKRFGLLLGRGMHLGKRGDGEYSDYFEYKRLPFGHALRDGFEFGKQTTEDQYSSYENSDNIEEEKRAFGHWLGHGFKLGKRSQEYPDDEYDKADHL